MNENQMRMIVKAAIEAIPINCQKMKEAWEKIRQNLANNSKTYCGCG